MMRLTCNFALCLLVLLAALTARAAEPAQQEAADQAPAYILFHSTVSDYDALRAYGRAMMPVMQAHGGRFLILADGSEALEGEPDTRRIALISFPSITAARAFWSSPDYAAAKALRADAGQFDAVLVEGTKPPAPAAPNP